MSLPTPAPVVSSTTYNVLSSTLTVGTTAPLDLTATYYFRVGSLNWNSVPNYSATVSTWTIAPPPAAPSLAAVNLSSITVAYGLTGALAYVVGASSVADFSAAISSACRFSLKPLTTAACSRRARRKETPRGARQA